MHHQAALSLSTFLLFSVPYGMVIARKAQPHDWLQGSFQNVALKQKIDRTLNNRPITFPAAASLRFHFHFTLTFISPAGSFIAVAAFWGSTGQRGLGEKLFSSVDSVKWKLFRVRSANAAPTKRAFAASNSIPFERACRSMHMGAPFILNFSDFLALNFNHFRENFRLTFFLFVISFLMTWRLTCHSNGDCGSVVHFKPFFCERLDSTLPSSHTLNLPKHQVAQFMRTRFHVCALPCRETIIHPCC